MNSSKLVSIISRFTLLKKQKVHVYLIVYFFFDYNFQIITCTMTPWESYYLMINLLMTCILAMLCFGDIKDNDLTVHTDILFLVLNGMVKVQIMIGGY